MRHETLQFEPIRRSVYSPAELYDGFDPARPPSWADTVDFRIYAEYQRHGGAVIADDYVATLRALHDSSMTQLAAKVIEHHRVVAVMGGHRLVRGGRVYRQVAELGRALAAEGFLVTTGGGPGAMEASHLGAALAAEPEDRLREAVEALRRAPVMPERLGRIVRDDGVIDAELAAAAHAWFTPVWEVATSIAEPARSLSVPTWHYGHEPSSPLATDIGKLFQNAIREDGLLAIATHGVVYAPGSAGTLQEIFQDAAQNFYESYGDRFDAIVHLTDDVGAALRFLVEAAPQPSRLERCLPQARVQPDEY